MVSFECRVGAIGVAVGLPFNAGSRIKALVPAERSSRASMIPPTRPTSLKAARTWSVGSAKEGRSGNIRLKLDGSA